MKVNVLHQTDLFHPHCDPDDHFDLACQYALAYNGDIELKEILIDYPPAANYGDPAIQAVNQLNYITGKAIPATIGTANAMLPETDYTDLMDCQPDFSGVRMVIKLLEKTDEPVVIHIAGSCRDIAIAGKIRPDLFKTKCKAIYLNAGASKDQMKADYNVELDPYSYSTLFGLQCTIYWMPCFEYYPKPPAAPYQFTMGEFSTFYSFRQDEVLPFLSDHMQKYFAYALGKVTDQRWLSYLNLHKDEAALDYHGRQLRNMWCTAGFLHCAGKTVTRDGRIVTLDTPGIDPVFCFEQANIASDVSGHTKWSIASEHTNRFVFRITDMPCYQNAMTSALRQLLSQLP